MTMSVALHSACAVLYLVLAVFVLRRARLDRTIVVLAASCLITSAWAGAIVTGIAPVGRLGSALELIQSAAWFGFVLQLYHRSVPSGIARCGRLSGLGFVTLTLATCLALSSQVGLLLPLGIDGRLGLAACAILLIENLYRNALDDLRWHITLPCVAIGGLFLYDIVLYSDAALFRRISPVLMNGRVVLMTLLTPLLALFALRRRRWSATIAVSHRAVFYSASLVAIGIFLLALAATGEIVRELGPGRESEWGMVVEVSLICGGILAAALFLTSASARSSLRNLIIHNFLSHRFDYRLEWLRCIATLSGTATPSPLHTRVIKAVAQTVDSPGGLVFLREPDDGVFRWAGSWNLPAAIAPIPAEHPLVALFRDGSWVVEAPAGMPWLHPPATAPSMAVVPDDLWLAVPLSHAGRLSGFVLVARPRAPFVLDHEVFALLRIVGREVANTIAEQRAAEALLQTRQLREYGQRFAFVAHDIKNLSSQLSLLLANAERHIANPEFQRDMLGTVSASVQKINVLLARLKAPPEPDPEPAPSLTVSDRLQAVIDSCMPERRCRIELEQGTVSAGDVHIAMAAGALEDVVTHLLNNAFEASPSEASVRIRCQRTSRRLLIDIVDQGHGMTSDFIRAQLFRPFSSSKSDGFGIGVYQARQLLRQAGGDLIATSEPGVGTTMRLSLPLDAGVTAEQDMRPAMQHAR